MAQDPKSPEPHKGAGPSPEAAPLPATPPEDPDDASPCSVRMYHHFPPSLRAMMMDRSRLSYNKDVFSDRVLDHTQHPRNVGPLEDAFLGESGVEGDGPFIKIWLRIEDEEVRAAAYKTYGCPACIACASLTAELSIKRNIETLNEIEPSDLILILGGLPEGKEHCPRMAVEALRDAIGNARGCTEHL